MTTTPWHCAVARIVFLIAIYPRLFSSCVFYPRVAVATQVEIYLKKVCRGNDDATWNKYVRGAEKSVLTEWCAKRGPQWLPRSVRWL